MNDGFGRFSRGLLALGLWVVIVTMSVQDARAEEAPGSAPDAAGAGVLDGFYVALGPLGAVTHASGAWDGNFGAEAHLMRIREGSFVTALGVSAGASRYARAPDRGLGRGSGRIWAEFNAGIRLPGALLGGVVVGLGGGVAAEVDSTMPARPGVQGTVWVFAGVIPYVRVGRVEKNGAYIDFGIKVALPVLRI